MRRAAWSGLFRYVRDNFWPARTFTDLGDLNAQADLWCVAGLKKSIYSLIDLREILLGCNQR